jgi:hypothetical protein
MSFAQGAPTQNLSIVSSNVFLYGSSTVGNAFTVQQLSAGNVASFQTSTNATALIINPSGQVGIGKTNPAYAMDITGDLNFTGTFRQNGTPYIGSQWTGTTSLYFVGNVGIGTTNPQYRLHVTGAAASTVSNIVVETGTDAIGQRSEIRFGIPAHSGTGKRAGITSNTYVSDGSDLQFWTNATSGTLSAPRMTILQSGFVGIGTTNPTKLLQVWGGMIIGASSDSRATTVTLNAPGATTTFSQNADIGDGARIMCLQCPDLSSTTANLVSFSLQVAPTGSFGSQRTSLDLKGFRVASQSYGGFCITSAFDTAGSYDLFYADRTKAYFQQNVGIGTVSPGVPLVVYGSNTTYQFTISSYNTSLDFNCGTRFGTLSPGFTTIDPNGSSPQGLGIWDHLAINGTCAIGAGYAQTTPSPANSLIVAGNIGVGTASPARRLHLYDAATSGAGPFLVDQFAASGFTDTVTLIRTAQAATSGLNMCVMQSSSGGNNLFYVRGDGYVWAANDITAFSDARVKTNLQKIEGALDKVSNINGYTFSRTDYTSEDDRDKRHVGVIAQEIQKVLPELVHEDDKGMLSVAYGNMTALLIEALKEERSERLKVDESLRTTIERLARLEKLLLKE